MTSRAAKIARTVTVVRGKRGPPHSSTNATRKRIVRTSAIPTAPATFHCTFSQLTQTSVARKSVPVSLTISLSIRASLAGGADGRAVEPARPEDGIASDASFEASENLGELFDACAASETLPILGREQRAVERSGRPAGVQLGERARERADVVGCRNDARARLADELGRGSFGGHRGEDRPLRGQVLEDLPRQHALAPPARVRDQQEQGVRVALERKRLPARHVRVNLEPGAESERLGPLAVGNAKVADEPRHDVVESGLGERGQKRPRIALPEEAPRVRDAEAVATAVLEAGEVVEVRPVEDRRHDAGRIEPSRLR